MGKSIVVAVLVAVVCALMVWALGRLLDSQTMLSVAVAAGVGSGAGYLITSRIGSRGPKVHK